jgi:hypothetical protein
MFDYFYEPLYRTYGFGTTCGIFFTANGASFDGEIGTHTKSVGDNIQLDCKVKDFNENVNVS